MVTLLEEIETLIHKGEDELKKVATPREDMTHQFDTNPTKTLLNLAVANAPSPAMYLDPKLYDGIIVECMLGGSSPSCTVQIEDSGDQGAFSSSQDALANTGVITANTIFSVTALRPWVRVRPTITAGTLTVRVTPARGVATLGRPVQAYDTSDALYVSGKLVTPKKAFANIVAASTDGSVVAAVAGKAIRVLAVVLQTGGTATTAVFNSKPAGAGTAISMTFQNGANGGATLAYNPKGWFDTNTGEGLSATTGAGSTTGFQVVYALV